MSEYPSNATLKDLVSAKNPAGIGFDVGRLVPFEGYRMIHPDYNPEAVVASFLKKLGLPSLETKNWDKDIAVEVYSPHVIRMESDKDIKDDLLERHKNQLMVAGLFRDIIRLTGGRPNEFFFVDDVHVDESLQDSTFIQSLDYFGNKIITHVENGLSLGSGPVGKGEVDERSPEVIVESGFRPMGVRLIHLLQQEYSDRIRGGKRKRIKGGNGEQDIYLWERGKDGSDSADPSCDILDLAHRRFVSQITGGMIILIPEDYIGQQERVLQLERLVSQAENKPYDNIVTILVPTAA